MGNYKIEINRGQSGKIGLTIPYNPTYIEKIKSIKGYRWNPLDRFFFEKR